MINRLFRSLFGLDLRREREGKVRVASSSTPLVLLFSFSSLLFSSLSLVCFPSLLLVCLLFLTMFTACCGVSVSQTPSLARIRHCSRGVRIICPQSGTADTNGNGFFISMSPNGNNNIVSSLPRSSKKKKSLPMDRETARTPWTRAMPSRMRTQPPFASMRFCSSGRFGR